MLARRERGRRGPASLRDDVDGVAWPRSRKHQSIPASVLCQESFYQCSAERGRCPGFGEYRFATSPAICATARSGRRRPDRRGVPRERLPPLCMFCNKVRDTLLRIVGPFGETASNRNSGKNAAAPSGVRRRESRLPVPGGSVGARVPSRHGECEGLPRARRTIGAGRRRGRRRPGAGRP